MSPRWRIAPADPQRAAALAAALALQPITAQILLNRGLRDPEPARRYLEPALADLADPEAIVDAPRAIERLAAAVRAGEPVTVYGDYDADGVAATAVLVRGLRALGGRAEWFVPSRFADGYGLHAGTLARLRAAGSRLIVAVDCGVTAVEEIAEARRAGQDVVVIDHHEPGPQLPPAVAVVDPKRNDAGAGFREYAASGLAFQLLRGLRGRLGWDGPPDDLLDLAALGTIADVVPLIGDNRVIARLGLRRLTAAAVPGVAALLRAAGIAGEVSARHVGFSVAPRLNAAGRLGDAGRAVRLLLTEDPAEAEALAAALDGENRARQQLCDQILTQAVERVEQEGLRTAPAIVLASAGWHAGVIGIVASQLVERYYRPVVLVALDGGIGKGSARSIPSFHMVDALAACADLLTRFGGHAMAAGLTIDAGRVEAFARRFTACAEERLRPDDLTPALAVDAEVPLGAVTDALARELEQLAPFGAGNPEPVLAVRGVQALSTRVMGDGLHLRMGITDGAAFAEAVGFRLGDASELLAFTQARLDLACAVAVDRWDDRERVQLIVRDLQTPGLDLDAVLTDSRLLVERLFVRADDYLGEGAPGIEDAAAFHTKVAGVTFEGRQEVVKTLRPGETLRLQREPANPVDPHAVAVLTASGRQVGYLSARIAARLAPSMDAGALYTASVAQITGGPTAHSGDRSYGVNIVVQAARPEAPAGERLWTAWAGLPWDALLDRLRIHLRRGRALPAPQREAIRAVAEGRTVLGIFGPGRGRAAVLMQAAVAHLVRGGGGPVVIAAPLRGQVERLAGEIAPALARIGLRVLPAHGALLFRRRQRLLQALVAGGADIIVTSQEFLRQAPPTLVPALVLIEGDPAVDGAALAEALDRLGRPRFSVFASSAEGEGIAALRAMAPLETVADTDLRTNLRLVDRRGAPDRQGALLEAAGRGDRLLIRVGSRAQAVGIARALRDQGVPAAYCHGGLPLRVREVLAQALADGRIGALVAADGLTDELMPPQFRQVVLAGLPWDRAELTEWLGATGADGRAATVTLLYGREDLESAQSALAELHPDRDVLAAIYRVLRERAPAGEGLVWPDGELAAALAEAVPSSRTVGAGLDILAEAGVLQRDYDGERWHLTVPERAPRRDLAESLRYTEGNRERQELAALAGFAFGPLAALLRAAAGGGQEAEGRPVSR
ncbi:MAG TPA: single-stranded-DNA-specific exonuclease RecJ [bacterium]|nr:single-stranded-DNA-specific exonuclease RecJ [bacterium]